MPITFGDRKSVQSFGLQSDLLPLYTKVGVCFLSQQLTLCNQNQLVREKSLFPSRGYTPIIEGNQGRNHGGTLFSDLLPVLPA